MLQKLSAADRFTPDQFEEAKKALARIEKDIEADETTFDKIKGLIDNADKIRVMFRNVDDVKRQAEWTILLGGRRIGTEILKVPKAGGPGRGKRSRRATTSFSGRGATGIPKWARSGFTKLARVERELLRRAAETLWAAGKDATTRSILLEGLFGDFKRKRALREKELATKIKALPDKKYGVILADPEWKFKTHSDKGKIATSAEKHYSTSELSEIKKRKVPAYRDCVLFLWGTAPMLPQALEVMKAWGFKYVTNIVWDKEKTGTGYWVINQHEHLLIGTRGKVVPPAMGTQWPSIIRERSTKHSRKPEKSYKLIEAYYPNIPKLELNLRGKPRPGWDGWGNEADV